MSEATMQHPILTTCPDNPKTQKHSFEHIYAKDRPMPGGVMEYRECRFCSASFTRFFED